MQVSLVSEFCQRYNNNSIVAKGWTLKFLYMEQLPRSSSTLCHSPQYQSFDPPPPPRQTLLCSVNNTCKINSVELGGWSLHVQDINVLLPLTQDQQCGTWVVLQDINVLLNSGVVAPCTGILISTVLPLNINSVELGWWLQDINVLLNSAWGGCSMYRNFNIHCFAT